MDQEQDGIDTRETMTPAQITQLMDGDAERLTRAMTTLESTRRRFETQWRQGPEEARPALRTALLPMLEEAEQGVIDAAETAQTNWRAITAQLNGDALTISPADEVRAAGLHALIAGDMAKLRLEQLQLDVRAAIQQNDQARAYLFARLLPERLQVVPEPGEDLREQQAREVLWRMLRQIQEQLRDRSLDPLRERATKVLTQSQDSRTNVQRARDERNPPEYVFMPRNAKTWPAA